MTTLLSKQLSTVSFNASGIHCVILDEVDNLTKLAQQSLKSVMNTTRAIFILTTNNISLLDKGLKYRCVLVEMNAASTGQLLPIACEVAADLNVVLTDAALTAEITAAHGSMREVMSRVKRLARKVAADLNVVLTDAALTAEIAAANGSMREVMSRVKRLARRK